MECYRTDHDRRLVPDRRRCCDCDSATADSLINLTQDCSNVLLFVHTILHVLTGHLAVSSSDFEVGPDVKYIDEVLLVSGAEIYTHHCTMARLLAKGLLRFRFFP
jgi:hypothetical protein